MGDAGRRGDLAGRQQAYQELADAAVEGRLLEVISAVQAIDDSLEDDDGVTFRTAVHQLTVAVYNLKHVEE